MGLTQEQTAKVQVIIDGEKAMATMKDMENAQRSLAQAYKNTDDVALKTQIAGAYQNITREIVNQKEELKGTPTILDGIKSKLSEFGPLTAAIFAVAAIKNYLSESVAAYLGAEKAYVQLQQSMIVANQASKQSFSELIQQSEDLSGVFSEKDIRQVQTYFSEFGLGANNIKKLMPHLIDFAVATGQTLPQAAEALGAGINGNEKILKRYGLNVDKNATKIVNFTNLLEQLTVKYKGQEDALENSSAAGAVDRLAASLEKFKEVSVAFLGPIIIGLSNFIQKIVDTRSESEKLYLEWSKSKESTDGLQKNITPLIDRYDELKAKTSLSKDEQAEMKDIIQKVGDVLPIAATAFDKYGKAIDISTDAARNAIKAQADLTAFKNKDALEAIKNEIDATTASIEAQQRTLNAKGFWEENLNTGVKSFKSLDNDGLKPFKKEIADLNEQLRLLTLRQKELAGQPLVDDSKTKVDIQKIEEVIAAVGKGSEAAKEELAKITLDNDTYTKLSAESLQTLASMNDAFAEDEINRRAKNSKKLLSDKEKFEAETLRLQEQYEAYKAAAIKDSTQREVAELEAKYQKEQDIIKSKQVKKAPGAHYSEDEKKRNDVVQKDLLASQEAFEREKTAIIEKAGQERAKTELAQRLENLKDGESQEKLALSQQRADNEIGEEVYQAKLDEISKKYLVAKIFNIKQYAATDKDAKKQEMEATQQLNELQIKMNDAAEKKIEADEKAGLSRRGLTKKDALEKEGKELQAIIAVQLATGISMNGKSLRENVDMLKQNTDEQEKIWVEHFKKVAKDAEKFGKDIETVFDSIAAIQKVNSDKALAEEKSNDDKSKQALKASLDAKKITQVQYDTQVQAIDDKLAADQKQAAYDDAKQKKNIAIFQATLKALEATVDAIAAGGLDPELDAAAAATWVEVDVVAQTPLPEMRKGTLVKGKKHEQGGQLINAEDGELLLSSDFVDKNPELAKILLYASQNTNGDLRQALPSYSASQPEVNFKRVVETNNVITSGASLSSASGFSKEGGPPGPSTGSASGQDDALKALHEAISTLNGHLEKGITANAVLGYRQFTKDLARYQAITGNVRQGG